MQISGDPSVEHDDSFALVALAAKGDRAAAGAYFQKNHRLLMAMAHRIGGGVIDADDLLSEAMVTMLTKWTQGVGPDRYANAYLIQTMRNRVKDELKSPRSRVSEITDTNAPVHDPSDEQHVADMHREYAIVRQALDLLSPDQRTVLVATVLEGRKPAELETELGRPAAAIYSLSRRARLSLRRATLRVVLEDRAPQRCREAASELPDTVVDSVDDAGDARGMEHIRTCTRCRAAWARFGTMSSALGIVTLLTVSGVLFPSGSAEASELQSTSTPALRSGPSLLRSWARHSGSWSISPMRVGAAAVALGSLTIAIGALVAPLLGPTPPTADFAVTPTTLGDRYVLDVSIVVDRPWTVDQLTFTLPSGFTVDAPPPGWICTQTESEATQCTSDVASASGGDFVLSGYSADRDSTYRVDLIAHADGYTLNAFKGGPLSH
ncbi:RNA polymerase sigma factor [Microbacterium sp. Leaf320]|uniref:RNA polymerase sigma factor n=1 Tax=Microbacterium sp. Leaf320 TaxID=1736334 RepID=UPI0009EB33DF|nr:sigma-70 family RNA polymerase sigma factor [Microbacterium sp. Leaf320]